MTVAVADVGTPEATLTATATARPARSRRRQAYSDCDRALTRRLLQVPADGPPTTRRIHIPAWIVRAPEWQALEATDRATLLAILGYADAKLHGRVSYATLVLETGHSESTVIASVARLERAGWLQIARQRVAWNRNATNVYQIVYPGEAAHIDRAVERAAKEGMGARQDARVEAHDVYLSRGAWKVRKAFLHAWEFASSEWQSLMRSPWALDVMLVVRSQAIAGEVGLSKLDIARIVGRVTPNPRSKSRVRTRVLEATSALVKLGVLKVVLRGGPTGRMPGHTTNLYAPCVPPSCAHWSEHWRGSAPGVAAAESQAESESPGPQILGFPGVLVAFYAGSAAGPDAVCPACVRAASHPRRHLHRPSADPHTWSARYCPGPHTEPVIAGCPDCGAPLADGPTMELGPPTENCNKAQAAVVTVDAAEGDLSCARCGARHPFGEAWDPDLSAPDSGSAWVPLNADRIVRVWLARRHESRAPIPSEVDVATALILETGNWWAACRRILVGWRRHESRDVRYLTGLAKRAGYTSPTTS